MRRLVSKRQAVVGASVALAGIMLASTLILAANSTITTGPGPTGYGRPTNASDPVVPAEAEAGAVGTTYSPTVFNSSSNLKISGSTTVYPILNAAMPGFLASPAGAGVVPDLQQGGSGRGRTDGGLGLNDLAASSSAFKTTGKWGLQDDDHDGYVSAGDTSPMWNVTKIARDGIEVILNESVNADPGPDVTQLTFDQIAGIYKGSITNWNQVGGPDMPIKPFAREIGGGTRTSFLDFIATSNGGATGGITEDQEIATIAATTVDRLQGNPGMIAKLDSTDGSAYGGIGYVGFGFSAGHNHISLVSLSKVNPPSANYVSATKQTIYGMTYPMSRSLQVGTLAGWTNPRPGAAANAQAFITYLLSNAGQMAVAQADFLKLRPDADVNQNGVINTSDVAGVGAYWNQTGAPHWVRADANSNGIVNTSDVAAVGAWWNFSYTMP